VAKIPTVEATTPRLSHSTSKDVLRSDIGQQWSAKPKQLVRI
jgi:hypothetical protein